MVRWPVSLGLCLGVDARSGEDDDHEFHFNPNEMVKFHTAGEAAADPGKRSDVAEALRLAHTPMSRQDSQDDAVQEGEEESEKDDDDEDDEIVAVRNVGIATGGDEIAHVMSQMEAMLRGWRIEDHLLCITICRSVRDGYLPRRLVERIETGLLRIAATITRGMHLVMEARPTW